MRTEIPLSKTKVIFGIVACVSFTLLISNTTAIINDGTGSYNKDVVNTGSIILTLFFLAFTIVLILRLFKRKPGLIVDEQGIYDNASTIKAGLIKWQDIKNIRSVKQYSASVLLITVAKPESYIAKVHSLRAPAVRMNIQVHGTPIVIHPANLNYDFTQLQTLLTTAYKQYKK